MHPGAGPLGMSWPPRSFAPAPCRDPAHRPGRERPRLARWLPRAGLLAALLLGFAAPAHASLLDRLLSWFGVPVQTEGLAVALNGTLTAQRILLRDADGTWAELDGVSLHWAPLRLLRGDLQVSRLQVQDATLERLPRSSGQGGSGGGGLPGRFDLKSVIVQRLTLDPAVAGTAVTLHVEAAAQRSAADTGQGRLRATEIGGPASYEAVAALTPSGVRARLTAREAPGGPLARIIGLSPPAATPPSATGAAPRPAPSPAPGVGGPLVLVATADGPLAAVATEASLSLGAAEAKVHGTVDLTNKRLSLDLSATAPAMTPVPGVGWTQASLAVRLGGGFAAPEATGRLDVAGLAAGGAQAQTLALQLAMTAASVQLHGQVDGVHLPGAQPDLLSSAPVRFTAEAQPNAAGRPVTFTLMHPLLHAHGRLELGATQHLTAQLTLPELGPFAALSGLAAQGQVALSLTAARTAGKVQATLDGTLGLTGGPAAAVALLGPKTTIAAAATYADAGLSVTRLHVAGPDLILDLHGAVAPDRIELAWQAALARLQPLNPRLAGRVEAAGRLFGPPRDLALNATLSGAIAARSDQPDAAAPTPGGFTAQLALTGLPGAPQGTMDADGQVLGAPLRLALRASRAPDGVLNLDIRQAAWKSATASGSLRMAPGAALPDGTVQLAMARLSDLAPLLGRALAGSLRAELKATADRAELSADVRGASLPGVAAVRDARLRASLDAPMAARVLNAQLALAGVRAGGIDGTVQLDARGPLARPGLRLSATVPGLRGAPLSLTAAGQADLSARSLTLATLDARWQGRSLRLRAPARVSLGKNGEIALAGLRADLAGGTLTAEGRVGPALDVTASISRLPASLVALVAPSLPAAGLLSGEVRLTGSLARPVGTIRAQGSGLRLLTDAGRALPPGRLDATATLAGTSARLAARLAAGSSQLALEGTVGGGPGGLGAAAPLALRADGTIDLKLANPLLAAGGQRVGGRLLVAATVGGTLAAPRLGGQVQLAGGDLRDEVNGIHLRGLSGRFVAAGDSVRLVGLTGRAGSGTIGLDGTVGLLAPGLPVALRITAQNARPLAGAVVTADLDADMTLRGNLRPAAAPGCGPAPAAGSGVAAPAGGPAGAAAPSAAPSAAPGGACAPAALAGTVRLRSATIRIPSQLPPSVQTIPVRVAGAPHPAAGTPAAAPPAAPFNLVLALRLDAPQQVFVRGRGLNAELGGTVRLGGSLAALQPRGGFRLIRGTFNLVGQTLTFTSGDIRFQGGNLADPALHLVASTASDGTTSTLTVGGTASAPTITLSSVPELPQDEILARLLFRTGSGSLSPFQLAAVAAGLAQLSGGGGALPNPLEAVRSALGLDQLGVGSGANGRATLRAGRYISPRLYVGAEQGTGQQSTQATVTYDLTKRLQVHATAGTGETTSAIGASGQTSGESVGIRFQMQVLTVVSDRSRCQCRRPVLSPDIIIPISRPLGRLPSPRARPATAVRRWPRTSAGCRARSPRRSRRTRTGRGPRDRSFLPGPGSPGRTRAASIPRPPAPPATARSCGSAPGSALRTARPSSRSRRGIPPARGRAAGSAACGWRNNGS